MKKTRFCKALLYAVLIVMVTATALFAAGCGGSDKFEGNWIGNGTKIGSGDCVVYLFNIKKNGSGNGYIVTVTETALHGVSGPEENTCHYYWSDPEDRKPRNGLAKDNILELEGGFGSDSITYIESDKKLRAETSSVSQLDLKKAKDVEKELEGEKASVIEDIKQKNSDTNIDVLSKEEWDKKNEEAKKKAHDIKNSRYYDSDYPWFW